MSGTASPSAEGTEHGSHGADRSSAARQPAHASHQPADPFPWSEFRQQQNTARMRLDQTMDILTLAALSVSLCRHWFDFNVAERGHILAHCALVLAGVAWRLRDCGSYQCYRHWLAPVLRVSLISGPGAWKITTLALQEHTPWGGEQQGLGQGLGQVAVLLFASAVATNCTMALARSVQLPAHAATQAVVLGILLYVRQQVCSTPIFLGPSGRAMLDTWRGMLDWLQLALPLPLPLPLLAAPGTAAGTVGGGGDATALCRSVLGGFQLLFGYVLPVLLVALAESRSFVQFEKALAQRDAAAAAARPGGGSGGGARQDAGWLGRLYRALAAAGKGADGMFIWPATMTLLAAACWEAATTVLA